ncbi:MAG: hypothetical protein ACLSVD_06685 [Eggerthellaceae bacterium]
MQVPTIIRILGFASWFRSPAEALSSGKQQPAFCGQIVHRFYLLGGLTLDGFDEALVKLGVETQHVSYVIEEPVE